MLLDKARLYAWGAAQAVRLGRPDVSLGFLGGLGDDLLCTAPIEEWLRRGARRVWFFTRHPELYPHYDDRVRLVPEDGRYRRLAELFGQPMRPLNYAVRDSDNPRRDVLPSHHIIVEMCRAAGLHGEIALRPHLRITAEERGRGAIFTRQIAIQSTCLNARIPYPTKDWGAPRFADVARALRPDFKLVQLGASQDFLLPVDADLRGHAELRHSAAVLAASDLFIGTEGFLAHLARAVDCPAVVVMGGRARPEVFGYAANENLYRPVACSPCGLREGCPYDLECMREIGVQDVIAAARRLAARRLSRPFAAAAFMLP